MYLGKLVQVAMLLTCIQDVSSVNQTRTLTVFTEFFIVFAQSLQADVRIIS
jgi:hypothetical protein